MKSGAIFDIAKDSIADEAGLRRGDIILSVNGHEIEDEFDFRFYTAAEYVELCVQTEQGEEIIEIFNPDMEDFGVGFESALFEGAKSCKNKCIFCFIDQLPAGMRKTLYFKDDDSRLSFLRGNYITLTNASDKDIEKIIKMRFEPINVSVHTTDPGLRVEMLKNPGAGNVLDRMRRLSDGCIHMNCQIVLVSGVNDGNEIDRTVWDLAQMHPYVQSISAVPAGITKYRRGLYPIKPFTREESKDVLARVHSLQEKLLDKIGTRLIYAADEFYINAGYSVPGAEEYEGYHQIENGVGLMRSFEDEFMEAMETVPPPGMHVINIITGVCAYEKIFSLANIADSRYNNVRITVFKVTNEFFGEHVTVAGLVTGGDITAQMSDKINGGITLIPDVMLREGTDVFLDDVTVSEVERRLETKIEIVKPTGFALWKKIIGR